MMRAGTVSILLLWAASAGAEPAQAAAPSDPRADAAVSLFQQYCVANRGTRDQAVSQIAGHPFAKPLPDDVIANLQGDRKGGIGWLVHTTSDGQAILAYDPIGICEVAVVSADPDSMRRSFGFLIDTARSVLKVPVTEGKAQTSTAHGMQIVATPFSFPLFGKTVTLTLTTAGKTMPVGFQHTMTSAFNPIAKAE